MACLQASANTLIIMLAQFVAQHFHKKNIIYSYFENKREYATLDFTHNLQTMSKQAIQYKYSLPFIMIIIHS